LAQFMLRVGELKDVKLVFSENGISVDVELSWEEVEELVSILSEWLEARRAGKGSGIG